MTKSGLLTSPFIVALLIFALTIQAAGFALDASKYIGIDEVQPGMEAYCLSVFSGTEVEKFGLKILSVVRGTRPGQDMILVLGTDERFQHSSAVHGCSGSSVFIDGRLAGALAAGWDGSLDPHPPRSAQHSEGPGVHGPCCRAHRGTKPGLTGQR